MYRSPKEAVPRPCLQPTVWNLYLGSILQPSLGATEIKQLQPALEQRMSEKNRPIANLLLECQMNALIQERE